jgi:hypothetical protein
MTTIYELYEALLTIKEFVHQKYMQGIPTR